MAVLERPSLHDPHDFECRAGLRLRRRRLGHEVDARQGEQEDQGHRLGGETLLCLLRTEI